MWISILLLIHVVAFLLIKNEESEKRDREKKINNPVIRVASDQIEGRMEESGYYDPDRQGRERISLRNNEAVDEIDRTFKTITTLRMLKRL